MKHDAREDITMVSRKYKIVNFNNGRK